MSSYNTHSSHRLGNICKNVPSSPLRRPVKTNIYKRSRVIINTLSNNEPNPAEQNRGEVKDKNQDKIEIENKNEDKIEVERFQRDRISFPDEKQDEELNENLNNNLYSHGQSDD